MSKDFNAFHENGYKSLSCAIIIQLVKDWKYVRRNKTYDESETYISHPYRASICKDLLNGSLDTYICAALGDEWDGYRMYHYLVNYKGK